MTEKTCIFGHIDIRFFWGGTLVFDGQSAKIRVDMHTNYQ